MTTAGSPAQPAPTSAREAEPARGPGCPLPAAGPGHKGQEAPAPSRGPGRGETSPGPARATLSG